MAEFRAATDGLTGLPNQRAVTDALKRTFAQALTTRTPLALLLLDLDHFKQINDQRGHPVGDQVLANVGATLSSVLRSRDFAGRKGGEEFAVLLPGTEIATALEIAERVRSAISEISVPGTDVTVTASVGAAGYPDHAATPDRRVRQPRPPAPADQSGSQPGAPGPADPCPHRAAPALIPQPALPAWRSAGAYLRLAE